MPSSQLAAACDEAECLICNVPSLFPAIVRLQEQERRAAVLMPVVVPAVEAAIRAPGLPAMAFLTRPSYPAYQMYEEASPCLYVQHPSQMI